MSNYTETIELYSITAEGITGKDEYRDRITINAPAAEDFDSILKREIINFALKYDVDNRLVNVYRGIELNSN